MNTEKMNSNHDARPKGSVDRPKRLTGSAPGLPNLPQQRGVYRCALAPVKWKKKPEHADYKGYLAIANGIALVNVWVHADGSLGLRLEKVMDPKK